MRQIKKEDIIDEKSIIKAFDNISNAVANLISKFNGIGDKFISDSEIDFIVAATNDGIDKNDIKKAIREIRKAAKKLKLKKSELHGVYLALKQMVVKH